MIDVKQAIKIAHDYLLSLYNPDELIDLLLEEVERSEDDRYWYITFGFTRVLAVPTKAPQSAVSVAAAIQGTTTDLKDNVERVYKKITVRADTGKVQAMKIRRE
ncbi:MAG: hypothetical protein ABI947_19600 [Chloroflexota bacterium]